MTNFNNEYPNTFPVRFKKALPAHRICGNALGKCWTSSEQPREHHSVPKLKESSSSSCWVASRPKAFPRAVTPWPELGWESDTEPVLVWWFSWFHQLLSPGLEWAAWCCPNRKDPSDLRNTRVCFGPRGWRLTQAQTGWDKHDKHKHLHLCPKTLQGCTSSPKEHEESASESEWWAEDSAGEEKRFPDPDTTSEDHAAVWREVSDVTLQHQPEHWHCSRKWGE